MGVAALALVQPAAGGAAELTALPGGLPNGPLRDYGTPTAAPGKTCPFTGNIPVSLPAITSPVGTSIPGLAAVDLSEPSVPTNVYGELCMSEQALAEARAGHPPAVLVLVHGITYGTYYWDFPYEPQTYSTVNSLVGHGYATLNLDRVGDGRSDHPLSALVNAPAQAEVVHQLVNKLKAGQIGGVPFGHVGLVGHSYGTVINWIESAIYNDTDLDIGTGYSDRVDPVTAGSFIAMATPALASAVQRNQPWAIDPGYLQPLDTARGLPQLYYAPNADPAVIDTDRRLANTVTVGEAATFVPREYDGTHKNITIPTFSIQGEYDIMTCGDNAQECSTDATGADDPAAVEQKSAHYTQWQSTAMNSQSCFRGAVIPDASHNVALHRNAPQFQAQVMFFADQAMGVHGENTARYRQVCATHGPGIFDRLPELTRLVPPFPVAPPPLSAVTGPLLGTVTGN
ncbi:alpha/beta hydrolase [Amycolatopsis sp.]|uniref:alpha/beta hydrolase n=1 Tax=Amycolatopsis sp. TaxID=37632 RepID=UPI002B5EE343|nr:alpha/beta hydrolase [Amycolatopsis sp.]HVV08271.1 alpha/beta hydrolase [Amycolatopsis sp.]